jgi:hypothetical protein
MSTRQRNRERHEVLAAEKAPPSFLDWSEDAITFSREDHLNRIPNPASTRWWSTQSSGTRGSRKS